MKVVYLSNSIGKKNNGGSSLSGLRFLELLEIKFGSVTLVTDEWQSPPKSIGRRTVELTSIDFLIHDFSLKQLIKMVIFTLVNIGRKKIVEINSNEEDVLLVVNSFTSLIDKVVIKTKGKIIKVCVVRGDTTSFVYQSWGGDHNPLEMPKLFLKGFNAIIYVSKSICTNWVANGVSNPHWYLPNSIDEDEVARVKATSVTDTQRRLGMRDDKLHIVVVGSIQERKGQDLFVSASDRLFAAIPNVCVHFIGVVSTPFGGDRIVESLKNSSRGHYIIHGHRDNALEFVHAADIAVLTSKSEAFPRAIAEYLAIGKPIISTRVAGADEMIKHKKNGLLIEIDDADGLVDSIKLLANDLDLRKSFGREACASYCALYSAKQQLKSFNDIFDEIVSAS